MGATKLVERFKNPITKIILAGVLVGSGVIASPSVFGEGFELVNSLFEGYSDNF